ncbi:MAG: cell division protein ZapA [Alphaproteobacteria bacterium]|nr:MAG: cell division protein ZapA [Alphaproteobacteria bacterium]
MAPLRKSRASWRIEFETRIMSQVSLEINGRLYTVACDDGEEAHLTELAEYVNKHVVELAGSIGQVGDSRLLLMASLMVADELAEALQRVGELEDTIATLKVSAQGAAAEAEDAGDVLAEVLDRAAARVEEIAAHFNRA